MLFNSDVFLFYFLPAVFAVYALLELNGRGRAMLLWFIAASLFFYAYWAWQLIFVLLASLFFNYGLSLLLAEAARRRSPHKGPLLALGIAANLGALGFFKYSAFIVQTIDNHLGGSLPVVHVILPLAISFFTFQQIAYLVDVSNDPEALVPLDRYAFFVTYFPHLIAGPICYRRDIIPQLGHPRDARTLFSDTEAGIAMILIGLFKKIVLSAHLQSMADPAFALDASLDPVTAWRGVLAFSLQIYFDFSAYSDIALGLGMLFGVRLPLNFFSPYKAASIIEFWRIWHISLGRFLRDYLYIPLGGSRHGIVHRLSNVFLVMLLAGLWHGANWTFVAWGGLHGIMLAFNHLARYLRGDAAPRHNAPALWFNRGLTFAFVTLAWVLFRSPNFATAANVYHALAGDFTGTHLKLSDILLPLGLAVCWLLPNSVQLLERFTPACTDAPRNLTFGGRLMLPRLNLGLGWGIALGILAAVTIQQSIHVPADAFIYFHF